MRRILRATILCTILAAVVPGAIACHYVLGYNFRTVDRGEFYRARQMPAETLEARIKAYDIKTVVNLRGASPGEEWYDGEIAACARTGAAHVDFDWTMRRLPEPESLLRFVQLLASDAGPFLVHCEGGTHRTGVASACYQLLQGKDLDAARDQFGLWFNDAPIGELLELYEGSELPFDQWVAQEYPALYEQLASETAATGNDAPNGSP